MESLDPSFLLMVSEIDPILITASFCPLQDEGHAQVLPSFEHCCPGSDEVTLALQRLSACPIIILMAALAVPSTQWSPFCNRCSASSISSVHHQPLLLVFFHGSFSVSLHSGMAFSLVGFCYLLEVATSSSRDPPSNLYFKPSERNLEELLYSPVSNHIVYVFSIGRSVLLDAPVCIYCCTLGELSIFIATAISKVACESNSTDKLLEEELESLRIASSRLVSILK